MSNYLVRLGFLISCSFFLLSSHSLFATHIVGGELNYTCLGGNQYEITLTVFRDCFYGDPWFDDPASVGIFDADNNLVTELGFFGQLRMEYMDDDTLDQQLMDPCFFIPEDVCVHTTTYRDTLILPFIEGGYTLAYQRCCRNQTILNIEDPLASGATYLVRISEQALTECNSNAKFKFWPPIYICVDEPIDFDHGAIDIDGDSLVYKLCTPLLGATQVNPRPQPPNNPPYDSVVWVDPPYSVENMLGGDPLTIDPETGFLTGVPNTIGQFVVGICVEEYRDGELISLTRRDFQYNVGICGRTTASFFTAEFYCNDEAVTVENRSTDADFYEWYFDAPGYRDSILTDRDPVFEGISAGNYNLTLIAISDRGCRDTFSTDILVLDNPLDAEFAVQFGQCTDSVTVNAEILTVNNDTGTIDTNWYFLVNDSLIDASPPFRLDLMDSLYIILELIASNGCPSRDSFLFSSPFLDLNIPDTLTICRGQSIELYPGADPDCEYSWLPDTFINDVSSPNPVVTPPDDILYTVTVFKVDQCDHMDSVFVQVEDNANIISLFASEDSTIIGGIVTVFYEVEGEDSIGWQPFEFIQDEFPGGIEVNIFEDTELRMIAYRENGCNDTAVISLQTFAPPCDEPYIFIPNAFSPNGDNENDFFSVRGQVINNLEGYVYNRWGEKVFTFTSPSDKWDGTYNGKDAPVDGYGYFIRYQCLPGGPFTEKQGNVSIIR